MLRETYKASSQHCLHAAQQALGTAFCRVFEFSAAVIPAEGEGLWPNASLAIPVHRSHGA